MESMINEVILNAIDPRTRANDPRLAHLSGTSVAALQQLWNKERPPKFLGLRKKYQDALLVTGKKPFTETRDPFKSADLVIQLRNSLVHYKPEWEDIDAEHKYERLLKGKFPENTQPIAGPSWYPDKALAAGCADWVCDASVYFVKQWWQRMRLRGRYDLHYDDLETP